MLVTRTLTLIALVALTATACSRKKPPVPTPPVQIENRSDTAGTGAANAARVRADSMRAADERARADAAARSGEMTRVRESLGEMVFFEYDQAVIREGDRSSLDRKVAILRANPNLSLRIEGHADERGSVKYNLALSLRRATAIRDYLTGFGIAGSRFEVVPMGEERPLESGASEDAFQRNRRGEFHITRGGDALVPPR